MQLSIPNAYLPPQLPSLKSLVPPTFNVAKGRLRLFLNVSLMSDFPSPSHEPSPASPVRSTEVAAPRENELPTTSSEPAAITSAALARRHEADLISRTSKLLAQKESVRSAVKDDNGDLSGRSVNNPHLPPSADRKNDPSSASTDTNTPITLSDHSHTPNWHPFTPSINSHFFKHHSADPELSSTNDLSPPTAVIHRRSGSDEGSRDSSRRHAGIPHSATSPLTSRPASASSSRFFQSPRPRAQDLLNQPGMIGMDRLDQSRDGGVMDAAALSSGRHEALSENRNRSSSRSSSGRVEKHIEATMAEAEPANARSRKSSHMMGLFKENTSTSTSTSVPPPKKGRSPHHEHVAGEPTDSAAISEAPASFDTSRELREPLQADQSAVPEGKESRQPVDAGTSLQALNTSLQSGREPKTVKSDVTENPSLIRQRTQSRGDAESSESKQKLPSKLLEEIRGYHNLAAPVHDKFRSVSSKVPTVKKDSIDEKSSAQEKQHGETIPDKSENQKPEQVSSSPTDEDYESEKEHISSALYYPHQAPSPEALQDMSIDEARKAKEADDTLSERLPEPAIPTEEDSHDLSDDVGITLQSHNKNKYLHGDMQKALPTSGENDYTKIVETGTSSASESEYESQEEPVPPSFQDESSLSEDQESTPKASPTTKKSYLRSRFQKTRRVPSAPVGAVELKPYNHQVGGHTKVFRFSKRAVAKQLSNRENVFYEEVEHQHPELLKFMPR